MFKPLNDLLPGAINRLRVAKPVEATVICRATDVALGELWDHAVPMRAISYRAGVVTVAVTSSAWAHEVLMQSERIKEQANRQAGGTPIKKIRARVSPAGASTQK